MTQLDEVIQELTNSSFSMDINQFLMERFVGGSPDRVFEAIESQFNSILDDYNSLLINVFEEIQKKIHGLEETITQISEEKRKPCCKGECLPTNTR